MNVMFTYFPVSRKAMYVGHENVNGIETELSSCNYGNSDVNAAEVL